MDYLSRIESDPAICGGKPCVAGTRTAGDTVDELLGFHPYITRDDVFACLAFAAGRSDFPVLQAAE